MKRIDNKNQTENVHETKTFSSYMGNIDNMFYISFLSIHPCSTRF